MDPSTVERLVDFINTEISRRDDPIDVETDLLMTGTVDSLGVVQITLWMEDELGIDVDPLDVTIENFLSVERMVEYVRTKRSAA